MAVTNRAGNELGTVPLNCGAGEASQTMHTGSSEDCRCGVSVVMPCLNEARSLALIINNAFEALAEIKDRLHLNGEVVVADNGSTDGSVEIAKSLNARVVDVPLRGYGNALMAGMSAARGQYIVMGDADGSYDFKDSVAMVERLATGYDICVGNRFRGKIEPGAMPFKNRYIGNPALTGILNFFFRTGIGDAHCGLRAFTRSALERLQLTTSGMEFASESIIKAQLLGLKTVEVPVSLNKDLRDRPPHLRPWRDGWRHLRYILMLTPEGIFLAPSLVLMVVAMGLAALILLSGDNQGLRIGHIELGDHWMIIAGMLAVIGHQLFLFGIAGIIYGVQSGYRATPKFMRRVSSIARLETTLIIGAVILAFGLSGILIVTHDWINMNFSYPHKIRELVASCSLIVIGTQQLFGGFLIAILAGNKAKFF